MAIQNSRSDKLITLLILVLLSSGLYCWFALIEVPQYQRLAVLLASVVASLFLGLKTNSGQKLFGFLQDSLAEVRRVVWPTQQETIQTTIAVVVMVTIMGLVLWVLDSLFLRMVSFLTGHGWG